MNSETCNSLEQQERQMERPPANGSSTVEDVEVLKKQLEEEQTRRKKANTNLFETKAKLNKLQKEREDEKKSYEDKIEDLNNTINLQAEENDLLQQLVETRENELSDEQRNRENVQFQLECVQGDIEEYKLQLQQKDKTIKSLRRSRHVYAEPEDENEADSLDGTDQNVSSASNGVQLSSPSESTGSRKTPRKRMNVSLGSNSNVNEDSSETWEPGSSPLASGRPSRNSQERRREFEQLREGLEHYKEKALSSAQHAQSLEAEVSSLKRELNQLRKDKSSLNSQHQDLEQSNIELQSQIRAVRTQLEQEQSTIEQLRRSNRELTSEKADLESTVSILKRQTQYSQADNEDTMKHLRERINHFQEQLDQSRNENLNLAQENGSVKANVRNMEHALAHFVSPTEFDTSHQNPSSLHVSAPAIVAGIAKDIIRYVIEISRYFRRETQTLKKRTELLEDAPRSVDSWSDYLSWVFKQDAPGSSDSGTDKDFYNVGTVSEAVSNFSSIVKSFQHYHRLQENHWKSVLSRALTEYCNVKEQLKQRTVDIQEIQCQSQQLEKDLQDAADYGAFVRNENQQLQEQVAAISEVAARNSSSEEQARQLSAALRQYRQEISRMQQNLQIQPEGHSNNGSSQQGGGSSTKILKDTIRDQKYEITSLRQRIKEKDSQLQHLQEQLHYSTERTKQRLQDKEFQVQHLEHQLQNTSEQLQLSASSQANAAGNVRETRYERENIPNDVQSTDVVSYAVDLSMLCEEDEVGLELLRRLLVVLQKRSRGEGDEVSEADIHLGDDSFKLKKHIVNLEKSLSILQRQCETIVQDYLHLSRRMESNG
eukprot:gb/GECG01013326.1/.p1 GENE.gb/GECG01013326.1/~~gb/GECG01013326.1/.p1  ORF type:complete len:826 (+),score=154.09 gb/GECG01013326.1/:1-2478(+)